MAFPKGQHPGTLWIKTDFQCHSPRDQSWTEAPQLPGGAADLEAARDAWALSFIEQCRAAKLGAVAITDHHDATFVPYVQRAATGSSVTVFPGIEVSCNDNTQCLAIFDPLTKADIWRHFLGKLRDVSIASPDAPKTQPPVNANLTITELFREVTEDRLLRDACVLIPHFSDPGAHKHLNENGHHLRFCNLPCDAVYIEKAYQDLSPDTVRKAYGDVPEWGKRRRAIVATGDNRSSTWRRLGLHDCYIKMGENSLEALRQALIADEARIAYAPPSEPSERVVELTVLSTLTGPLPITASFNSGFNAFIGGRGSGKSAFLEYLRFALARTERDLGRPGSREREEQLIEDTLSSDGYVSVVIEREGVREVWRRTLHDEAIHIVDADGTVSKATPDEARRRFRGRAFFQKQLSTTTREPASAADQITGIVAAEALDRRRQLDQEIANAKRDVATTFQRVAAHWQCAYDLARTKAWAQDIKKRIDNVNKRLEESGVSAGDLAIIADAPRHSRGSAYLQQLQKAIEAERNRINTIIISPLPMPMEQFADVATFPELATLGEAVIRTRERLLAQLEGAREELVRLGQYHGEVASHFATRQTEFHELYAGAEAQQEAHKTLLTDNSRLREELNSAEQAEGDLTARLMSTQTSIDAFEDARQKLASLIVERRAVLNTAADRVVDKSNMLKARLKRDPAPKEYIAAISALTLGAHVPDAESRIDSWIRSAISADQTAWTKICEGAVSLYQTIINSGKPTEPTETVAGALREFLAIEGRITPRQLQRIYQNITDATLSAILASVPDDYVIMTYSDDGRDMPFAKASPGQQASALLELLLNQAAGTLIIDQPEDDLDNRVIMKIVELIRRSKGRRQLIFTTHNPNIVVNGDADKVISLKAGDAVMGSQPENPPVEIAVDGAIETADVRFMITHIMEGGQAAFDLRSRKYRFDGTK
ncbi:TrlF family AAA-like ATPase [Bradyrhizobium sp. HKCCYLRH3099]|uniref:TrlF family AAA-like ATPase n=1 Tax=unclassified Bradyrhizobium TaxID=2631580 RepID=UPI003EBA69DC